MNLALYAPERRGSRWVFTEHRPEHVSRTAEHFRLGASRVAWMGDQLVVHVDEYGAPFGGRVTGEIRLRPTRLQPTAFELDAQGRHHWWPVAPHARAEVRLERPGLSFTGSAYHDTNYGDGPLERDFVRWSWSRAEVGDRTVVLYDALMRSGEQRPRALSFGPDGHETIEIPELHPIPRGRWGVGGDTRTDQGGTVQLLRRLEDGPHYTRSLLSTQLLGQRVEAMHESLDCDRFARPLVRAMLPFRMRWGWRARVPEHPALTAG